MNWTGGNLQRFSNKGKGNVVAKKQRDYFARQRLRLQDQRPAQSPLKFGPFDFRDSSIELAKEPTKPAKQVSSNAEGQGKHEPRQARLEDFDSTAGVANRLANMNREPVESFRRRKRSRTCSQGQSGTSTHQARLQSNTVRYPPPQKPSRDSRWGLSPPEVAPNARLDTHPPQRHPSPENSDSLKPKFSFLEKDNWVGIAPSKPVQISFPTANERDRIGKRRKVTKEDLARRQAPARPQYEPSLEARLEKEKRFRHDGFGCLSDDISIRIGDPGQGSQGSINPTRTSIQPPGTQVSSDSMLLDIENAVLKPLTPTQLPAAFTETPRRDPRSVNATRHQILTMSPQESSSRNIIISSLPRLRKRLNVSSSTTSIYGLDQHQQASSRYIPQVAKQFEIVAPSPLLGIEAFPSTSLDNAFDSRPRFYGQIPIGHPVEYTSSWKGLSTSSQPIEDIVAKSELDPTIRSGETGNGCQLYEEARVDPNINIENSSGKDENDFNDLPVASVALQSEEPRGRNGHWQQKRGEIGFDSSSRKDSSPVKSYAQSPQYTRKPIAPAHAISKTVEAAEDGSWMKFIFGTDLDEDKDFDKPEDKTGLLKKQPGMESTSEAELVFRISLGDTTLNHPERGEQESRLALRSSSHVSSLLTVPDLKQSPNLLRSSIDQLSEDDDFVCSNESLRGSEVPSPGRPTARQTSPSVKPIKDSEEVASRIMANDSTLARAEGSSQCLQEKLITNAGSLLVDLGSPGEQDALRLLSQPVSPCTSNETAHTTVMEMSSPDPLAISSSCGTIPASTNNNAAATTRKEISSPDPLATSSPNPWAPRQIPVTNLHKSNRQRIIFSRPQPFIGKLATSMNHTKEELVQIGRKTIREGKRRNRRAGNAGQSVSGFVIPRGSSDLMPDDSDDIDNVSDF